MHQELGRSLAYLARHGREGIFPDVRRVSQLIQRLDAGVRFPPEVFGRYYQLAFALLEGRLTVVPQLWADLLAIQPVEGPLVLSGLQAPSVCPRSDLYRSLMEADGVVLRWPDDRTLADFQDRFDAGMSLIDQTFPELGEEIRGLVREVVCVVGDPQQNMQFDGGSHFQLWGALFINAEFHQTPSAMMEVLAHESAHGLLFGFCTHEPLVLNDDDVLHPSPLRADPRPMDGIFHATFVSARMHLAMSKLLRSGALPADERSHVAEAIAANARHFQAGDAVIRAHGQLTDLGRDLIGHARAYMQATVSA